MYMTYDHRVARAEHPEPAPPTPMTPYRANAAVVLRSPPPNPRTITPDLIPELESIVIHIMVKEAVVSKHNLLSGIMALRALSGEASNGGNRRGASGVQVIRAKVGAASFRLRAGMPIAAKVEIKGEAMYDFVQTLVDFVIPRIRDYPGIPIPADGKSTKSPSVVGGVFQFGLPPSAMALFPQIEANIDAYPRMHGMHLYFKTNQKGPRAETTARVLMSAFRLPFYRK
ncbi:ribosomal protein L5 domain-containing protein [Naematelia encephala]|uniref:Ribosomal protein L5 domain-containing protein n=1 Tax=Naematelia encephala TaxID=71784 RepID=A0A1Y2AP90_9TREE|nr:ribosomal protein L5 domain-containing protein [Naematelia encephala]